MKVCKRVKENDNTKQRARERERDIICGKE